MHDFWILLRSIRCNSRNLNLKWNTNPNCRYLKQLTKRNWWTHQYLISTTNREVTPKLVTLNKHINTKLMGQQDLGKSWEEIMKYEESPFKWTFRVWNFKNVWYSGNYTFFFFSFSVKWRKHAPSLSQSDRVPEIHCQGKNPRLPRREPPLWTKYTFKASNASCVRRQTWHHLAFLHFTHTRS